MSPEKGVHEGDISYFIAYAYFNTKVNFKVFKCSTKLLKQTSRSFKKGVEGPPIQTLLVNNTGVVDISLASEDPSMRPPSHTVDILHSDHHYSKVSEIER